jgi:hypothetical protein
MAGFHVTLHPEEALEHCGAVVGEAGVRLGAELEDAGSSV